MAKISDAVSEPRSGLQITILKSRVQKLLAGCTNVQSDDALLNIIIDHMDDSLSRPRNYFFVAAEFPGLWLLCSRLGSVLT